MREAEITRAKDLILLDSFKLSLKQKASEELLKKPANEKKPKSKTNLPEKKPVQPKANAGPGAPSKPQPKAAPQQSSQPSMKDLDQPAETSLKAARDDTKLMVYVTNDWTAEEILPLNPKSTHP